MYTLTLNPMMSNAEKEVPVARGETEEGLIEFVKRELADEPYKDGQYFKVFKKGSRLENFNPPWQWGGGDVSTPEKWVGFYDTPLIRDIGTRGDWIESAVIQASEEFDNLCSNTFDITGN